MQPKLRHLLLSLATAMSLSCNIAWAQQTQAVPVEALIIGGEPVPIGDYPFTASLQVLTSPQELTPAVYLHACGGALIGDRLVATAAHCKWTNADLSQMRFVIGRTVLADDTTGQIATIRQVTRHPKYLKHRGDNGYDFALFELSEPVSGIEPVALLERGRDLEPGTLVRALGWGITETGGYSDHLRMVDIPVVDIGRCAVEHGTEWVVNTQTDLCAGRPGKGTCSADSGSPLLAIDPISGVIRLAGITSSGSRVCTEKPSIFAAMASAELWDTMP